ncbi:MAG TPA: hypothetical protein VGI60_13445 [Chthoniobacterales bacterium]|jgi:hypothetical protein
MNDFSEIEAELRKLRPASISQDLHVRVERALASTVSTAAVLSRPRRRGNLWWSLGLSLAGASAFVLLGLAFLEEAPHPTLPNVAQDRSTPATVAQPNDNGFRPDALTRVVYQRRDEGLIFSPNQSEQPLRRVRYDTRETMQWRNPQTGASLRVSYPAEQVVLTPVSFQ